MYLLIDTSEHKMFRLALFDKDTIDWNIVDGNFDELLEKIDAFIKPKNVNREDIEGVMIVEGTGSFTSTRIASVVANAFAYAIKIPVLAITKEQSQDPQQFIDKLQSQKIGEYIKPEYSEEPNIG